jgi:hypothetical protein
VAMSDFLNISFFKVMAMLPSANNKSGCPTVDSRQVNVCKG